MPCLSKQNQALRQQVAARAFAEYAKDRNLENSRVVQAGGAALQVRQARAHQLKSAQPSNVTYQALLRLPTRIKLPGGSRHSAQDGAPLAAGRVEDNTDGAARNPTSIHLVMDTRRNRERFDSDISTQLPSEQESLTEVDKDSGNGGSRRKISEGSHAAAVAAPCTPPQTPKRHLGLDVSPPRSVIAWKCSRLDDYDLVFDSVEMFKKWLQTSTTRTSTKLYQFYGNILDRRTWDDRPGWGVIGNLNIMSPAKFSSSGIASVMWMHWGNGSIHVSTMSDDAPTPYRSGHEAQILEDATEQAVRRVRIQLKLLRLPNSLLCEAGLLHDVWRRVQSFLY